MLDIGCSNSTVQQYARLQNTTIAIHTVPGNTHEATMDHFLAGRIADSLEEFEKQLERADGGDLLAAGRIRCNMAVCLFGNRYSAQRL